jgi:transposase
MFSYVSLEQRVPQEHPLRAIRKLVDQVLKRMSKELDRLYAEVGRPSIPPERLLRALLLQVFYSIRSERLLMEQLDYSLLFRWFVRLEIDDMPPLAPRQCGWVHVPPVSNCIPQTAPPRLAHYQAR